MARLAPAGAIARRSAVHSAAARWAGDSCGERPVPHGVRVWPGISWRIVGWDLRVRPRRDMDGLGGPSYPSYFSPSPKFARHEAAMGSDRPASKRSARGGSLAHLSAGTRAKRAALVVVAVPRPGPEAVRRPAVPRRAGQLAAAESRGTSPLQAPSDRPSANSRSIRHHTNPGTTPTRSRACRTAPRRSASSRPPDASCSPEFSSYHAYSPSFDSSSPKQ